MAIQIKLGGLYVNMCMNRHFTKNAMSQTARLNSPEEEDFFPFFL